MSLIKLICYGKSAANGECRRCDERLILIDRKLCWGFAAQWGYMCVCVCVCVCVSVFHSHPILTYVTQHGFLWSYNRDALAHEP